MYLIRTLKQNLIFIRKVYKIYGEIERCINWFTPRMTIVGGT